MADYSDKYTKSPLSGKDVGVIFGKVHKDISLGEGNGSDKDFTFTPTTYGPFYPMNTYPDTITADTGGDDVNVYVDGVKVGISAFDPDTGVATLTDAPANKSVVTGDCCEQMELYMAQDAKLTQNRETDTLDQLRCSVQRESDVAVEFTFTSSMKMADLESLKFIFSPTTTSGRYEFPDEPIDCSVAIIIEDDSDAIDAIFYCNDGKAKFGDMLNVSAGTDAAENDVEIVFSSVPVIVVPSETS